jgi:hypothetical protein
MNNQPYNNLEIQICTYCDLSCWSCDRASDEITDPPMTIDQLNLCIQESIDLDWKWKRIRLLGGEPTIHPRFRDFAQALIDYRDNYNPECFLQVLTNGLGKAAKYRAWLVDNRVSLHAEAKEKGVDPPWFNNTRIVPIDRDPTKTELPPCGIYGRGSGGCGIQLSNFGYFLDGAGATVARVGGFDIAVMHLKDVTFESMENQAKVLCSRCGHHNPVDGSPLTTQLVSKTGHVTGKFWTEALKKFKEKKPIMKVYGKDD